MAYVALYRKWRPQGFDALVGQEAVRIALTNALNMGRIAHAYLFAGPRGTGKTSTAKIFAKAVNCSEGLTSEPCGKCINCERITDGSSMDVFEIDAASNRGIDEIRELREKVMFTPVNGRYKVYIIDEAHMLTTEAFNALLKTLEEPPAHVIFILATTEPHKIPATIHSRCQRFDFKRVTDDDIVKRLREVADGSDIKADDEALRLIAAQSDGGMRDALSLLDQCGVMADFVDAEVVRNVLGIVGRETVRALVKAIGQKQLSEALRFLDELDESGKDMRQIVGELAEYLRAVLLYKVSPDYSDIYLTDDAKNLSQIAPLFTQDRLMAAEERLHQATYELRQSVRGRLAVELCLFDLCRNEGSTIAALTARIEELEAKLSGVALGAAPQATSVKEIPTVVQITAPETVEVDVPKAKVTEEPKFAVSKPIEAEPVKTVAPAAAPKPKQSTPQPVGDVAEGEDLWKQLLDILKGENKRSMVACAAGGQVYDFEHNILTVVFKNRFNCKRMNDDDYKAYFESVLLRLARQEIRLNCVNEGEIKPIAKAPVAEPKEKLEPMVQAAMDAFGGALTKL